MNSWVPLSISYLSLVCSDGKKRCKCCAARAHVNFDLDPSLLAPSFHLCLSTSVPRFLIPYLHSPLSFLVFPPHGVQGCGPEEPLCAGPCRGGSERLRARAAVLPAPGAGAPHARRAPLLLPPLRAAPALPLPPRHSQELGRSLFSGGAPALWQYSVLHLPSEHQVR